MTRRASWKGHIKFGDFACEVGLYSAITSSEKISFNIVNRKTGNRVERQYVDSDTGEQVDKSDQVRGFELDNGDHVIVEGDEIAALMPDSNKVIDIENFIACDDIDKLYFDRPYFLAATDGDGEDALSLLAQAMQRQNVVAIAEAVLFRRNRNLIIRPHGKALIATTLSFDYEVRSQNTTFKSIPDMKFDDEMLELASHIIKKRAGKFDPAAYADRYNDALAELVKAKIEGRPIKKPIEEKRDNVVDLKEALRRSAAGDKGAIEKTAKKPATKTKKAS
ncbi:Ku protein [Agrobacterium rosae]|uniref:Non-homologous end joining protein Ku n=1 Tax=Agrobacterium rosae TaxID=1972867 RepID=A0AAE5VR85_9HYPH|nr:Ku protein [Agrobacterium rosae]KAA3513130.1 Ku protein [Agrobacterium rosae]KAA3521381.1 Ku protein [Agrobacterium rosae]MCM2432769.1 Ku protein [Agrobacterium rosae]MDX8328161.1 Ku protein [Agrobacterium rosae]MQB48276.1 Ku protein [Agrobacterium rosae]